MTPSENGHGSSPVAQPWERWPNETAKAFAAFTTYRDMGPTRSLSKAAGAFYGTEPTPRTHQIRQMKEWSGKHLWVSRALEYDEEIDRRRRIEAEEYRKDMDERQRKMGRVLLNELARYMNWIQTQNTMRRDDQRPELPGHFTQLLQVAVNTERTAAGATNFRQAIEEPERTRPQTPVPLTTQLMDATDDLLRALEAARDQENDDKGGSG
jgi:hypothetical protein